MKETEFNISRKEKQELVILDLMKQIFDPEIPVISIVDLGIIRRIETVVNGNEQPKVVVTITPTYSGCPAMDVISMNIRMKLLEHGFRDFEIQTSLSPAWTTDWMSAEGKEKLAAFGIAPPNPKQSVCTPDVFQEQEIVQCPHCKSFHTSMVSRFGSTPCKALYQCADCNEPFDYFKCH